MRVAHQVLRHHPSEVPVRRPQRSKIFLPATILVTTFAVAACDSRSSTSMNPVGPGGGIGMPGMGASGGMGGMPGRGMGMEVASEFDYLTQMIPHHEEAIAAAKVLQRGTERQEMRNFAVSIVETQTAEAEQMKAWLAAWYPGRDTHVDYDPMMRDLTGLGGSALDRAFLDDMIPHHMMAVMMSQQFLTAELANHAEAIPFARNIRDVQHSEIQTMAGWLRDWFGASPGMGRR
jgi:uncharacterized protein (DUF305 family)